MVMVGMKLMGYGQPTGLWVIVTNYYMRIEINPTHAGFGLGVGRTAVRRVGRAALTKI